MKIRLSEGLLELINQCFKACLLKKKGFHALSVGLFLSLVSLFLGLLLDNYGIYSQYKIGIRFGVSLFPHLKSQEHPEISNHLPPPPGELGNGAYVTS